MAGQQSKQCHFELYDKLLVRGWEQRRGRAAWGGGCLVSALEEAQMGYKVVAKGNNDGGIKKLGEWQRSFHGFQVHCPRHSEAISPFRNVKCVIGKKSGQHNGFATPSTECWSPNHRQAVATLPAVGHLVFQRVTSFSLRILRADQCGMDSKGLSLTLLPIPIPIVRWPQGQVNRVPSAGRFKVLLKHPLSRWDIQGQGMLPPRGHTSSGNGRNVDISPTPAHRQF